MPDGDAQTFLKEFEGVAELARIRSDRGKLMALRVLLKGRARAVLDAVRRDPEKMKLAAAKDALIAGFDTLANSQQALRSFRTMQLGVGVDSLSRAVVLRAQLNRALATLDDVIRSESLLNRFMKNLEARFAPDSIDN
ncbi:unnamed protein product [Echinostoma caproni]|uniref:Transposase n=1 Tax=Echinostoma caproni TaxID=27848 RepID=A0A183AFY9_9TREM|nr:unnamed protein product [Echinostoma caproni]